VRLVELKQQYLTYKMSTQNETTNYYQLFILHSVRVHVTCAITIHEFVHFIRNATAECLECTSIVKLGIQRVQSTR